MLTPRGMIVLFIVVDRMSVELLGECKKKLTTAVGRFDKVVAAYNSTPLEKSLHETARA